MTGDKLKRDIVAYAQSLGFGRVGVTSAGRLESAEQSFRGWLDRGCAGEMEYMEKNWERRARPADQLPGAKSVITLAVSYYTERTEDLGLRTEKGKSPTSDSVLSTSV